MNVFVREIGKGNLPAEPHFESSKLTVEDNIGESIHIHVRNNRMEFSVADFVKFAECMQDAQEKIDNGNY